MYISINFSSQIIVRRGLLSHKQGGLIHQCIKGVPCPTNKGVSYTNEQRGSLVPQTRRSHTPIWCVA
jgi:hypothetical protein